MGTEREGAREAVRSGMVMRVAMREVMGREWCSAWGSV